ncbi:MAG TPA: response regulator transcription factor [Anaerolineae bacterium]|mgnify:CR=1 FL=1|nr:response regulator transcription factor [Anaerolineae bacterium]HOR00840.1 response regulator transcription factor [Anaerolineae bacterium]
MRVLLADDHQLLLEGLRNLLEVHGIEVAGAACDGLEALSLARTLQPDVILMDIRMPGCDGLEATRRIKAEMPAARIVMLTTSDGDEDLFEAVKSGACGYLLKSIDAEALVASLEQALQGVPPFSPGLAGRLLGEFARLAAPGAKGEEAPAQRLTARQREVLALVAQGLAYKEVGVRLSLSARTVKYHMAEIMRLLHLEHRAQVLAYAGRAGLGGTQPGE